VVRHPLVQGLVEAYAKQGGDPHGKN